MKKQGTDPTHERRYLEVANLELRDMSEAASSPGEIHGYAAVFNERSEEMWGFQEIISPGAFNDSLTNDDDVRALWNHDENHILGRKKSGTLTLQEDARGLKVKIQLPDTQVARDLVTSMKRGDVDQMSFGFRVEEERWEEDEENDIVLRTLLRARLFDVSVVTFPAYRQTTAEARSKAASFRQVAEPPTTSDGDEVEPEARSSDERRRIHIQIAKEQI